MSCSKFSESKTVEATKKMHTRNKIRKEKKKTTTASSKRIACCERWNNFHVKFVSTARLALFIFINGRQECSLCVQNETKDRRLKTVYHITRCCCWWWLFCLFTESNVDNLFMATQQQIKTHQIKSKLCLLTYAYWVYFMWISFELSHRMANNFVHVILSHRQLHTVFFSWSIYMR